tara:strand:+ start:79548 stop:80603 length:1056 start_codon:yes stop_codon:yes gene_type:complete
MKKVLLIEDDTVVRENTAELLELSNYSVLTASNGKVGVELAKSSTPDIIICDIMMPELDGYGVLENLSKDTDAKKIPFIFLSAKTDRTDVRKGMDMGADDYLTKPFEEHELLSAIESRLAKVAILKENLSSNKKTQTAGQSIYIKNFDHLKNYFTDTAEEQHFNAGELIYQEGNNSNFVYLIYRGTVKCYKMDEQGKELITSLSKSDDFFGFSSLAQNTSYLETATALEYTEVFRLPKTDFKTVLQQNPNIALDLIDYLTDNVSEIKDQLLQMAYSSVKKKTANTIIQFAEKINIKPNDSIRISRNDLASVAGIATETFIRTLSGLKKDGLIDIEGRNIKILDLEMLKNVH